MKSRDKLLLAVVAIIGVLGAGWFLMVQPKREEARKLDEQITAARTELAGTAARAAEYRAARDRLRKHPEVFRAAGKALPNRIAMPDLVRTLTRTAKGTGVVMGELATGGNAGNGPATPGIAGVGLDLSFDGDFLALQRYLARLQRFVAVSSKTVDAKGRLVTLNSVQLTQGEAGKLNAKVSASVYVLQPGGLAAPAAAPTDPAAPAAAAPAGSTAAAPASTPTPGATQ